MNLNSVLSNLHLESLKGFKIETSGSTAAHFMMANLFTAADKGNTWVDNFSQNGMSNLKRTLGSLWID